MSATKIGNTNQTPLLKEAQLTLNSNQLNIDCKSENPTTFDYPTPINLYRKLKFDALSTINIWSYGVGHFQNDITATTLLNYMPLFLKNVVPINSENPGYYLGMCILIGQIVDGMVTPLVGAFSDRIHTRIGKRKPWHILGTFFTFVSYIIIFQECILCKISGCYDSDNLKFFNYTLFFSLYNTGWACCQVSHMSLVPSLSVSRMRRDKLNGLRNSFTYISNFSALVIVMIIFSTVEEATTQYVIFSILIGCLGLFCSIVFWIGVPEKQLSKMCVKIAKRMKKYLDAHMLTGVSNNNNANSILDEPGMEMIFEEDSLPKETLVEPEPEKQKEEKDKLVSFAPESEPKKPKRGKPKRPITKESVVDFNNLKDTENPEKLEYDYNCLERKLSVASVSNVSIEDPNFHWYSWFTMGMFYQYGLVYTCVRLTYNVSQTLIVFYVLYTLKMANNNVGKHTPIEVALVPLAIYVFSCMGSFSCERFYAKFGRKFTYMIGAATLAASSVFMTFLTPEVSYLMYICAIFIGIGQSLSMNTGITLIAEVIGQKGSRGAIVFGMYSFFDKVLNGIVLFMLLENHYLEENDPDFIRWTTAWIPAAATIVAGVLVYFGEAKDYTPKKDVVGGENAKFSIVEDFVE